MQKLESFCRAFEENDTAAIEKGFTSYLRRMISICDTNVRKEMKENFYHGILLGLFAGMDGWKVRFNAESGDGYSDICVEVEDKEIGFEIPQSGSRCILYLLLQFSQNASSTSLNLCGTSIFTQCPALSKISTLHCGSVRFHISTAASSIGMSNCPHPISKG